MEMDWIERIFHLSPDAGSGSLEIGIIAGAAVALAMVLFGALKIGQWARRRLTAGAAANRGVEAGR